MSISALVLLHPGFEELEAVAPIDLMSRADIKVTTASISDDLEVRGRSGITVRADTRLQNIERVNDFDIVVLPGGPGINEIRNHGLICDLFRSQHAAAKWIAAICAAPLILKDAGLISSDTRYTAFPATREELPNSTSTSLEQNGKILTSKGAGTATEFGLGIVEVLLGKVKADAIAASICWPHS